MRTITEAAKIVGLSRRMIQEYEKAEVAIKPPQRNKYGYQVYDDACMNRLWQIRFYRELGYGKTAIKAIFDNPDYDHAAAIEAQIELLEKKKQEIENLIGVAKLMKETGITPQSLQPRNTLPGAAFNDIFGFLGAMARQINVAEKRDSYNEVNITDEQFERMFEAFEHGLSLYKEGRPYDDSAVQEAVRTFHVAARPIISDSVSALLLVAYLITPGSEGSKAVEEEYQLPGVAEYLQRAIAKYSEDNIDSGIDKAINDAFNEIVALGKQKLKPNDPKVQAVVSRLFKHYKKTGAGISYLSPMDLMRSAIGYYSDPGITSVIDRLFRGKGASRYLAAALKCFCNCQEENL